MPKKKKVTIPHSATSSREQAIIARKALGAGYDPRTAAGQRELDVVGLGAANRASVRSPKGLFRHKAEATPERVTACEYFDTLWHFAHTGLLPGPKFEFESVGSMHDRLPHTGGGHTLDRVIREIGPELSAVLYHRVVLGLSYRGMEAQGLGGERQLQALFLTAADAAARAFGLKRKLSMVQSMELALLDLSRSV